MRAIELKQAKPRAPESDLEDVAVGSSPAFLAVMERSEARYRAEGGLSTEEVRARLGALAARGTSSVRKVRKAVARRSRG